MKLARLALAAAGALFALTACSHTAATSGNPAPQPATSRFVPNPVDVLRTSGCVIPADTKIGNVNLAGERYAYCGWASNPDDPTLTVWTYATPDEAAAAAADATRRDGQVIIAGRFFLAEFAPGPGVPAAEVVAASIGGRIVR